MSHEAIRQSIQAAVAKQLGQLIGLQLSAARRAADMRTLQFGPLRAVEGGSVGDFALHIQCPWRLEGPEGIVTGRLNLWEPIEKDTDRCTWHYERSGNLQDAEFEKVLATPGREWIVHSVTADEYGGGSIAFENGFALRLFPASTRGEDWRMFRPDADARHFVVAGGAVQQYGELDVW